MIRELDAVLALVEKATEGPWRWSENGNVLGHMPDGYDDSREVCAVYTDDEATGAPNAPAIIAAVNFLRQHGPALRAAVVDAGRLDWLESLPPGDKFHNIDRITSAWGRFNGHNSLRAAIDAAAEGRVDSPTPG